MGAAYTESQTKSLLNMFESGKTIDQLAVFFNKPRKSIIAKLSKEGVYEKQGYVDKIGNKPITKPQIVTEIEESLGTGRLVLLDKAPKLTLVLLRNKVTELTEKYNTLQRERRELKSAGFWENDSE